MPLVAIAAVLGLAGGFQDPAGDKKTFRDDALNLAFDHPATWKVGKRSRRSTEFEFPIPGTPDVARLEIVRTQFRGQPDVWQGLQTQAADQSKTKVVRQWTQDLLGAPVLSTLTSSEEKGRPVNRLSALFYTRSATKLLAKLEAPASGYDAAAQAWQSVTETFRTLDGSSLAPEDPNAPPVAPPTVLPGRLKVDTAVALVSEGDTVDVRVNDRPARLRLPKSATYSDGVIRFEGAEYQTELFLNLDTDASRTLITRLADDLAAFSKVDLREDEGPNPNGAGAESIVVFRIGVRDGKPALAGRTVVKSPFGFVLLTVTDTDPGRLSAWRKRTRKLVNSLALLPPP